MPYILPIWASAQLYKAYVILSYSLRSSYIPRHGTDVACVVGVGEQYADKQISSTRKKVLDKYANDVYIRWHRITT